MPAVRTASISPNASRHGRQTSERLLSTDVDDFIKVMTIWREEFLAAATLPIVGASEADLNAIKAPACLIAGNDVIHTPATARKAARLIPNS